MRPAPAGSSRLQDQNERGDQTERGAQRKAPRQPTRLCRNNKVIGAIAEPTMPENVWNENTWVSPVGRDVLGQQCVVGRVVDRVGEPSTANIAMNTQNESISPATAIAADPAAGRR